MKDIFVLKKKNRMEGDSIWCRDSICVCVCLCVYVCVCEYRTTIGIYWKIYRGLIDTLQSSRQEIKSKNHNEITLRTSKTSWIKENDKRCWYKFQERWNRVQYWSCHLSFSQKSLVFCSSLIRYRTQHFFYYFYIISAFMMSLFWSCLWSYVYKKLFQSRFAVF